MRECGLYVMKGRPYIGARPDGLVECECCQKRILEVKCPETMKKFLQENMKKTKENVPQKLKHTMTFFYQVQMQMNLTGVRHSVFVYISMNDNLRIKVEFYEYYFQDVVEKASYFFQKYVPRSHRNQGNATITRVTDTHVFLIPKPGNKLQSENLRPISLTSCVGKQKEHVILNKLHAYVDDKGLLLSSPLLPRPMIGFRPQGWNS